MIFLNLNLNLCLNLNLILIFTQFPFYMKKIIILLALTISLLVQSQSFHDTQGKLEISGSGQAAYTLPIAMPPSIQDVGPVINLTYASGQMGGIAGQGWSISSVSVISRVATRLDIDGFIDGVDFDDNDKLALDGQRLLLKTGAYWADGSTYETEVQSNTKVELKIVAGETTFIVTAPDGSLSWYGGVSYAGTASSSTTDLTAYYITRFQDTKGNRIDYGYAKPFSGSLCLNNIYFSANTFSTQPNAINQIVFTYAQAERSENAYIKGVLLTKTAILKKVEVFTNSSLFKRYELTHVSGNGYQRVSQLQEFNTLGEAANPVIFEYKTSGTGVTELLTSYTDGYNLTEAPKLSGDFDGDGRLDFISSNTIYTKMFQTGGATTFTAPSIYKAFVAKTITSNKYTQKQSIVTPVESMNDIAFKIQNLNPNGVITDYIKNIPFDNKAYFYNHCSIDSLLNPGPTLKTGNEYLGGDFNGDGLTEVLILSHDEGTNYGPDPTLPSLKPDPGIGCQQTYFSNPYVSGIRLIDLNHNAANVFDTPSNCIVSGMYLNPNGKRFVVDFNSDGKDDILMINPDSTYSIYSFKQLLVAPWVEIEIIGQGSLPYYSSDKETLLGDFNGDGKPDLMIPTSDGSITNCSEPNCSRWNIYSSNPNPSGGEYFVRNEYYITSYVPYNPINPETQKEWNRYFAMDVNKDGKTDLVRFNLRWFKPSETAGSNRDTQWEMFTFINNIGNAGINGFTPEYSSPYNHNNDDNSIPIPLAASYSYGSLNNDLLMIRYHANNSFPKTVTYINFNKDIISENYLSKVTQSGGALVDEITYQGMEPTTATTNDVGAATDFYSSADNVAFPFIELKKLPTSKLVYKLTNTVMGVTRYQDFKYHGYVVQLGGLGVIGFKATARSAWYRSDSDKKTWSANYIDPAMRGATKMAYTQLLNPGVPFEFNVASPTGMLSKSENTFTQNTDPASKRYQVLLQKQNSLDVLTNVINEKIYNNYTSDYLLPTSVTTNNYLGTVLQGSSTTVTTYDPPSLVAGNYYIGRPSEINSTITAYGDTKTSKEKIFYTGSNVTKTEKTPNNDAVTMVEEMEYFANGNLKKKTMRAIGTAAATALSPRSTQYTYDPSDRFVKTVTDTDLMVTTNVAFDPIYGTVLEQKNPYLQSTKSFIDGWGKRTKVTDFLGKSITYTYARANGIFTTTETGDDGSGSIIESDALAREIRKGSKDINGNWNYKTTEYDYNGRKYKESEPFAATTTASQWTTTLFDDYGRTVSITNPAGKVANATYNGLQVATNDGTMTKSVTKNANGHQIETTDTPGGTITYKYDAAGSLLENNYDGIKTTMVYDNWGRKTSMNDVSLGIYNYTYDAYGQALTESNAKGTTTYTYTAVGKPLTKKILGDGVDMLSTYTYDATRKWLNSIAVTNAIDGNSTFTYTYDTAGTTPTFQLNKTIESRATTPAITFTKELTFDNFGRVLTEKSTALAHSKTANKTIFHEYKNGAHFRLRDATVTGTILYQTDTENARGQLTGATLGNGMTIANSYDSFGFPTEIKHDKAGTTPVNVMTLNYSFDAQRGNLNTRYNSMFNYSERFEYDTNDRLTKTMSPGAQFMNLTFASSVEGFVYFGGTPGTAVLNTQKLKVTAPRALAGAKKQILTGNTAGKIIKIEAEVQKLSGAGTVNAVIRENDLTTGDISETILGTVGTGVSSFEYTTQFNGTVTLSYEVFDPFGTGVRVAGPTTASAPITALTGPGTPVQSAVFTVDNVKISNVNIESQNYDVRGRITDNSNGQYFYTDASAHPYQNTSVLMMPQAEAYYNTRPLQEINYNAFKRPIFIKEQGIENIYFGYNAMEQRQVMYYGGTQTDKLLQPKRRYYSADGSMEITYTLPVGATAASVEILAFVGGDAYSAPIVWKSVNSAAPSYFYLHRDNQSSILAITNATGTVVEKRLFDPWGNIIGLVKNGVVSPLPLGGAGGGMFFDRGYTGHEHLQGVGLINMNARLYDAKLHRFLQADNFVSDPNNTQNYNRYAYCLNNPLSHIDPSGNEPITLTAIIITAIWVGASVSVAVYIGTNLYFGTPITAQGIIGSAIIGAVSGAVTAGIGSAVAPIGNFLLRTTVQALAHGAFQGTMTAIQGGNFWTGFNAGALSSIAYSFVGGAFSRSLVATIGFGMITGGVGASLAGGNFWQGAVTGAVVVTLNHYLHLADSPNRRLVNKIKKEMKLLTGECSPSQSNLDKVNNLPTMKTLSAKSGKPDVKYIQSESGLSLRKAEAHFTTNAEDSNPDNINSAVDFSKGSHINVFGDAFADWNHLTEIVIHEYSHAYSRKTGIFQNFYNKNGLSKAYALDEIFAFQWQSSFGFSLFYKNSNIYLSEININLQKLGLPVQW
jgi:RHS repeat-associated protein